MASNTCSYWSKYKHNFWSLFFRLSTKLTCLLVSVLVSQQSPSQQCCREGHRESKFHEIAGWNTKKQSQPEAIDKSLIHTVVVTTSEVFPILTFVLKRGISSPWYFRVSSQVSRPLGFIEKEGEPYDFFIVEVAVPWQAWSDWSENCEENESDEAKSRHLKGTSIKTSEHFEYALMM